MLGGRTRLPVRPGDLVLVSDDRMRGDLRNVAGDEVALVADDDAEPLRLNS